MPPTPSSTPTPTPTPVLVLADEATNPSLLAPSGPSEVTGLTEAPERWESEVALFGREALPRDAQNGARLLYAAGRLLEDRLRDPVRAVERWNEAVTLHPLPAALAALRRRAVTDGSILAAAQLVDREVAVTADAPARADLLVDKALLLGDRLGAQGAANQALEEALRLCPAHATAHLALLAQAERSGDRAVQKARLERMLAVATTPGERAALALRLALHAEADGKEVEALSLYTRALDDEPAADAAAVARAGLLRVGSRLGRDGEVLRALMREAEAARPGAERAAWKSLAAALVRHRQGESERAASLVAEALREEPGDPFLLGLAVEDDLAAGRWNEAAARMDLLGASAGDPGLRAAYTALAAALCEERLGDGAGAMRRLREAQVVRPADPVLRAAQERIALSAGDSAALVEAAEAAAARARDAGERAALALRAAELRESAHGDAEGAVALALRALEAQPAYPPAVLLLDRLYATLGRWPALADLLAAHPEHSGADRLGVLYEERLGDPGRALALYGENSVAATGPHAARSLLRAAEKADDALVAAETALALGAAGATEARVAWCYRAGVLYEERAAADDEARRAYQEVLVLAPTFGPALDGLARIERRAGAWEALCAVLARQAQAEKVPAAAAALLVEVARLEADHLGKAEAALGTLVRAGDADAASPVPLLARARLLARAGRFEDLGPLWGALAEKLTCVGARAAAWRRQAEVLEWRLRKPREALVAVERAVGTGAAGPAGEILLERLLGQLGRHAEAAAAQEKRLAEGGSAGAARQVELALRLPDAERAVTLLATAADAHPEFTFAQSMRLAALRRLGREAELGGPLGRLAEAAASPAARAALWRLAAAAAERSAATADIPAAAPGTAAAGAGTDLGAGAQAAMACYERVLEAGPGRSALEALERLARARGDMSRLVLSRRLAVDGAAAGPDRALALWELGLAHAEAGDLRGAAADFERAIDVDSGCVPALRELARLRERLREPEAASKLLRALARALRTPEAAAESLRRAGGLAAAAGDDDEAVARLEEALDLDPESEPAWAALEDILTERADEERLARVLAARARAGAADKRRDRLVALAGLHARQPERAADAVAVLAEAVALDPTHVPTLLRWAEAQGEIGRPAEAGEAFRRAIAASGDAAVVRASWIRVGQIAAEDLGDLDLAAAAFRSALLSVPDDPEALGGLVDALRAQRRWGEAAAVLRRLAAAAPPAIRVGHLMELGDLLAGAAADPWSAADAFERALEASPTHTPALDRLEAVLERLDDPARKARALTGYLDSLASDSEEGLLRLRLPEVIERRRRLAELLAGPLDDTARAVEQLRMVVDAAPEHAPARAELAAVLDGKAAQPALAVVEHLVLLHLDPLRIESVRALRRLFERLGQPARAARAAAVLVCLRAADAADERWVRELRARPAAPSQRALPAAEFDAHVRHPDERHPATALLASIADLLPRLYPLKVEDWGVGRADRLGPRSEDPVRPLVERIATALGVGEVFDTYLAKTRVRDVEVDATDPPALLVAAALLKTVAEREAIFHLGRQLGRLRARTHGAGRLSPKDLDVLIAAGVRTILSEYGHGLSDEATLDDLSHRLGRAVPRKLRRAFEEAAVAVGESALDPDRWRAALEHTGLRAGLVLSDDVVAAFEHVVRGDRRLSGARTPEDLRQAARASAEIVELVGFALGDELPALQESLGITAA